eukprot:GCRY01001176.1.p1 GENE.GCRY01001176.1~~GCRY01001176.1.p1  ORF type:complete len:893 (+),score=249.14 GCRY01001176.1:66-2744(+)
MGKWKTISKESPVCSSFVQEQESLLVSYYLFIMSKFWGGDSSSSSESESEVEVEIAAPAKKQIEYFSSDDEEETKRVVKSAQDRRLDELESCFNKLKNDMKINDWVSIVSDFDALNKACDKFRGFAKEENAPRVYIKALVHLEDFLKEKLNTEEKRKMSPSNAKSMNIMKQRLKKNNKNYDDLISEFRENPESEESESEESESESESEESSEESSEEESSEEESEESDSEESESDSEEENKPAAKATGRSRWYSKDSSSSESSDEEEEEKQKKKVKTSKAKVKSFKTTAEIREEQINAQKMEDLSPAQVEIKLKELLANRGKKGVKAQDQIDQLKLLSSRATDSANKVEILLHLVSVHFDYNPSVENFMPIKHWMDTKNVLLDLLALVRQEGILSKVLAESDRMGLGAPSKSAQKLEANPDSEKPFFSLLQAVVNFIERLGDEYTKSLRFISHRTEEYVERMRHESQYLVLLKGWFEFLRDLGYLRLAASLAFQQIAHVYYLSDKSNESDAPIKALAHLVYKNGDEMCRLKTMLCQICHHAIHNRFYVARDLMLMSHLQDLLSELDVETQILYNRTMVHLGLSAFRLGLIKEAHECLSELCGTGHIRELLAQGLSQRIDDELLEREERRLRTPYHMHINLELIESVHLTSALLLEVPNQALHGTDRQFVISKHFRNLQNRMAQTPFVGPPESTRERIMTAARCLSEGDWETCIEHLLLLKIWRLLSNRDEVMDKLKKLIQVEGLRTYLFSYSVYYSSLSLPIIAERFQLSKSEAHSIISKLILTGELAGAWHQPTESLKLHCSEPSRLQQLAKTFAEKTVALMESQDWQAEHRPAAALAEPEGGRRQVKQFMRSFGGQKKLQYPQQQHRGGSRRGRGGRSGGGGGNRRYDNY